MPTMAPRLGKTALLHFLSQVAVSVSGFLATFVIARILGAEGVGVYALSLSLMVWVTLPIAGPRQAMRKRISEGVEQAEYFTSGVILVGLPTLVVSALILVFNEQVNSYVGENVAVLIVAIVVTNSLFHILRRTLHGLKKVAYAGGVRATERVLRAIFQIGLMILGYEIFGLFFGHAFSLLVASALTLFFVELKPAVPRLRHFRSLLSYAKYGWSGNLKGRTFNWMDTIVLGFFVSSSFVGVYEVSWTLASFLVAVSNSISSTLFPEISELSVDEKKEEIHHYLNEGLVFTGVFLIPGLFGAIAVGEDLLRIYNAEFTRGFYVLIILIAARAFDAYASQILSIIRAINRPDVALRIDLVFVSVNMSLNVVLVYLYGWHGAAVATLISGIVTLFAGYYSLSGLIGTPDVPYREIGKELVAGVAMFGVVYLLDGVVSSNQYVTVGLVFVGAGVYGVVLVSISGRIRQKALALSPV